MIWEISNIYLTKTKPLTEMKLPPLEREHKRNCIMREKWHNSKDGHHDNRTVEWQLNTRKWIQLAHGEFLWNFIRKPRWTVVTDFVTKCFFGVSRHFTAMSTVALLVAIVGVTSLLLHATNWSWCSLAEVHQRFRGTCCLHQVPLKRR
jgi:hypothetical protein